MPSRLAGADERACSTTPSGCCGARSRAGPTASRVHRLHRLRRDRRLDVPITVDLTIAGRRARPRTSRDSAPMVRGALNCTPSFVEAAVYHAVMAASRSTFRAPAARCVPITVVTKPGTVMHVVMPGASSMRGVTGYRDLRRDERCARAARTRPRAGRRRGRHHARVVRRPRRRAVRLQRARRRDVGRPAGRRERRPREPVRVDREHPDRDRGDGLADRHRALRPRPGLRRRGALPGRARDRAGLARVVPGTPLQVRSDRQVHRPYGLAGGMPGAARSTCSCAPTADERAADVCRGARTGRRVPPPDGRRGGLGRPLERDPAAVAADVLDEKISRGAARRAVRQSSWKSPAGIRWWRTSPGSSTAPNIGGIRSIEPPARRSRLKDAAPGRPPASP